MKKTIIITLAAIAAIICAGGGDNAVSNAQDQQADDFARRFSGNGGRVTTYTLTVSRSPTNGGSVTVGSQQNPGTMTHNAGAQITITANPNQSWTFTGWTGVPQGVNAANANITVTMNSNLTLTANFQQTVACSFINPRNGQPYRTVIIGSREWMAENLNCVMPNSWCYGDISANCDTYGRLYTWNAARTACPAGWRLPDDMELYDLIQTAGGLPTRLKARSPNWNGTDDFGFSALPGGSRRFDGSFGEWGDWWCAPHNQGIFTISNDNIYLSTGIGEFVGVRGLSVRCVRN